MMRDRRRGLRRGIIIGGIILIVIVFASSARFYTDILWFREVGFTSVLWTSLRTQFGVGVAVGLVTALIVYVNLALARRFAPPYRPSRFEVVGQPDPVDRYRDLMTPYINALQIVVSVIVGLFAGVAASSRWQTVLLWVHRVNFGKLDPQFHKDIGYFVFTLPFYNLTLSWLWTALIVAVLLTAIAHYFHGSITPQRGLPGVMPAALAHISVLLGLLALVKAVQYWLGRYSLVFSPRGVVTGASYTDVHAEMPALTLLAIISVISAVLFLVNIRARTSSLPLAAVAIWILTSILAGAVWPLIVQNFSVKPQELARETPYIERNLAATRDAFNLNKVTTTQYAAANDLTASDLKNDSTSISNVRLWDPAVLQQALSQLQAIRTYYKFEDVDVDRYPVAGQTRQVLISARELVPGDLEQKSKTWANLHLQYTHGYGVVASLANGATSEGAPDFLVSDVPGTVAPGAGAIDPSEARIYYGESFKSSEYSVVDSKQSEIDYPTDVGVHRSNYGGSGGIPVGGFFRRVLFAIREGDPNLVLSSLIDGNSKIMIYKNVRDRVLRAAPFLSLDNDPYVTVVDGRVEWVLDAYTTTPYYPYSQRFNMNGLIPSQQAGTLHGTVNYIRNSVKVVVDAYDGTMKFYVVDKTDPMIQAWEKAFPALFTAGDPPPSLQAHFRYPEDLFNVQSEVYRTYHMTQASDFYAKEDAWSLPKNPAFNNALSAVSTAPFDLPPAYLLVGLPGETQDHFLLTRPFTPRGRDNMISFMTGNSDPGEYGKLRVLQFPRQRVILGPIQVYTLLNQDPRISKTLSLLKQGGSDVIFGSLVTLPIKDSILYIQPLFVTGTNVPNPELKRVAVVYGTDTVMANTFGEALQTIFGGNQQPSAPGQPQKPGGNKKRVHGNAQLQQILAQANRIYNKAQAALSRGDFAAYGRLIKQLGRLLTKAQALSPSSGSSTPAKGRTSGGNGASSPKPAPSASPSP